MTSKDKGLDTASILRILPVKPPALLLDRVVELQPGVRVLSLKCLTVAEPIFDGHYPGFPVAPESAVLEMLVQSATVLVCATAPFDPGTTLVHLLGVNKLRFRRLVSPGDMLEMDVELSRRQSNVWRFKVSAYVEDVPVVEGEIALSVHSRDDIL